jgi:hypothetical protein
MLPDTGIDDVKKQRNAEYAKHINDPVLSSLKMEGIRLLVLGGVEKRKDNSRLKDLVLHRKIILKSTFKKYDWNAWIGFILLRSRKIGDVM